MKMRSVLASSAALLTVWAIAFVGCSSPPPRTRGLVVVRQERGGAAWHARRALVIGNGSYSDVPALESPEHDARDVARSLQRFGFDTRLVLNTNRAQLEGAVNGFTRDVDRSDLVLVYYAGHGISVGGSNYLLPVDFRMEYAETLDRHVEEDAYRLEDILSRVEARQATNVLIFDACRNNPWAERARSTASRDATGARVRPVGTGLSAVTELPNSIVVFATAPGRVALDASARSGRNSPFATALLAHLGEPRDIALVLRDVTADVVEETDNRQRPWVLSSVVARNLVLAETGADESAASAGAEAEPAGGDRGASSGDPPREVASHQPRESDRRRDAEEGPQRANDPTSRDGEQTEGGRDGTQSPIPTAAARPGDAPLVVGLGLRITGVIGVALQLAALGYDAWSLGVFGTTTYAPVEEEWRRLVWPGPIASVISCASVAPIGLVLADELRSRGTIGTVIALSQLVAFGTFIGAGALAQEDPVAGQVLYAGSLALQVTTITLSTILVVRSFRETRPAWATSNPRGPAIGLNPLPSGALLTLSGTL